MPRQKEVQLTIASDRADGRSGSVEERADCGWGLDRASPNQQAKRTLALLDGRGSRGSLGGDEGKENESGGGELHVCCVWVFGSYVFRDTEVTSWEGVVGEEEEEE